MFPGLVCIDFTCCEVDEGHFYDLADSELQLEELRFGHSNAAMGHGPPLYFYGWSVSLTASE